MICKFLESCIHFLEILIHLQQQFYFSRNLDPFATLLTKVVLFQKFWSTCKNEFVSGSFLQTNWLLFIQLTYLQPVQQSFSKISRLIEKEFVFYKCYCSSIFSNWQHFMERRKITSFSSSIMIASLAVAMVAPTYLKLEETFWRKNTFKVILGNYWFSAQA